MQVYDISVDNVLALGTNEFLSHSSASLWSSYPLSLKVPLKQDVYSTFSTVYGMAER